MRLDAVRADRLADLERRQAPDHPRAEHQTDQERRHRRHHGAKGDVLEHAHEAELGRVRLQPLGEAKQHRASDRLPGHAWASPAGSPRSAATTRSIRMKREPLTRTERASGASARAPSRASTSANARAPPNGAAVLALSAPA